MPIRLVEKNLAGMLGDLSQMLTEGIQSPNVRKLAEEAITGKENHIVAVFDFVKETFPYVPDPADRELFIHPNRIAEDYFAGRTRGFDCDDHALLNAAMLGSIGYKTRLALLDTDFDYQLDHAVAEVYSEVLQNWFILDTTSNNPLGWQIQSGRTIYVHSG